MPVPATAPTPAASPPSPPAAPPGPSRAQRVALPDPGQSPPPPSPPPVTGAPYLGGGGVKVGPGSRPIEVVVSDDPLVRIQQAKSFFQRNPGTWNLVGVDDAVRGALREMPGIGTLATIGEVTRYGIGQGFVDQVRWQIRTGRQPLDPWWMAMNKRSLEDPLLAEAYLRAGRTGELESPVLRSWAQYIELNDDVRVRLGLPVGEGYVGPGAITPDGVIAPRHLASGDAAHGVSLLTRLDVAGMRLPRVRSAYWNAHNLSIQAAFDEFRPLLEQSTLRNPGEGELQDSWGRFIDVIPKVNPPGNGSLIDTIQPVILPQEYPAQPERMSVTQRMFVSLGRLVGRRDPAPPRA